MPAPAPLRPFTAKQQRVIDAIGRGLAYPAIATLLGISVPTVKGHVEAIAHLLPASADGDDDDLSTRDRIFLYARHQRWLAQRDAPVRQHAS